MSDSAKADEPVLEDAAETLRARGKSPEVAAVLAWLIPGAGHLYAGHLVKGGGTLVFVLGLFVWGLFLSGGEAVSLDNTAGHPYAFLAQVGVGLPTGAGLAYSHKVLERPTTKAERVDIRTGRSLPDSECPAANISPAAASSRSQSIEASPARCKSAARPTQ